MKHNDPGGTRISFKRNLTVAVRGSDGIVICNGNETQSIDGSLVAEMALLLDGRFSQCEIVEQFEDRYNPLEIHFVLSRLEEQGLVLEEPSPPIVLGGLRDRWGLTPDDFRRRLEATPVKVVAHETLSKTPFATKLRSLGLRVEDRAERLVILVDDYRSPGLDALVEEHHIPPHEWLVAAVCGSSLWVGPTFGPESDSCWRCLAGRIDASRRLGRHDPPNSPFVVVSREFVPSLLEEAALSLLATTVLRWCVADSVPDLEASLTCLDLLSLESESHRIVPRPGCSSCGDRGQSWQPPLQDPQEAIGSYTLGGLRSKSPEEVWAAVSPHLSPITGIVGNLASHRGSFGGEVNVAVATVCDGRGLADGRSGLLSRCAGTGRTAAAARLAAVCEAVERSSGLAYGNEPNRSATFTELGSEAIHPAHCLLFSHNQYADREARNLTEAGSNFIPTIFDQDRRLSWTPLWSVRDSEKRYLPSAMCYFDWPRDADNDFCRADSNGCAAGSTLEESVLHGFFELVERDAAALWWYNRSLQPGVDLEAFDDPSLRPVPDLCRRLGFECWALDLTTDLGIPTFVALASNSKAGLDDPVLGFGAHLHPRPALRRALAEMSQLLANRHPGKSTAQFYTLPPSGAYLRPDPSAALRRPGDFQLRHNTNVRTAMLECVERVADRGLDFLILDQSRRGFGLSVARVVVPGLRPFWARLAPGRLYDVPVQLGRLDKPNRESDLNPSHLML